MLTRTIVMLLALTALAATPIQMKPPDLHVHYHIVCRDGRGRLVWTRDATNMVTTQGATELLNTTFKAGTQHTWYIGEIKGSTPSFAITDALDAHAGWTAIATGSTDITDANYPTLTLGTISGTSTVQADNSAAAPTFHQNSTITLQGFYLSNDNVVGDNAAGKILYGEASITPAPVAATYTVQVTATIQMSAG